MDPVENGDIPASYVSLPKGSRLEHATSAFVGKHTIKQVCQIFQSDHWNKLCCEDGWTDKNENNCPNGD